MKRFLKSKVVLTLIALVLMASAIAIPLAGSITHSHAASGQRTSWTVYDYNPSGNALAPRVAASSQPATQTGNTVSFPFKLNTYTALLTTTDPSLTGDLTGKTLSDTVNVTGVTGTFQDQNNGGCTPDNQSVRFKFTSPSAAGPSGTTGPGSAGFYTQFWWSNPVSVSLTGNLGPVTITAALTPDQWSDWNGKPGTDNPEAFSEAIAKVQTIGLSFGGGCFFENGVTTSDGSGIFSSTFSE